MASPSGHTGATASNTWSLPRALISFHSPFLRAASSRYFEERVENRIKLPEDNSVAFSLFVEWMYYGSYSRSTMSTHLNLDAICWVLGDKLLCAGFKNYAMGRLYARHVPKTLSKGLTSLEVRYARENSAVNSKLRSFHEDFLVENFGNAHRLVGDLEEWDVLLDHYKDIRTVLLRSFRTASTGQKQVRDVDHYLEPHHKAQSFGAVNCENTTATAQVLTDDTEGPNVSNRAINNQIEGPLEILEGSAPTSGVVAATEWDGTKDASQRHSGENEPDELITTAAPIHQHGENERASPRKSRKKKKKGKPAVFLEASASEPGLLKEPDGFFTAEPATERNREEIFNQLVLDPSPSDAGQSKETVEQSTFPSDSSSAHVSM
ncbi:hypothetical protein HJFPF1_13493 [Paramyrothecium foliicola]|nr:hypothetical protein HJFPF1_13493 [Paramyrothecium foliicola]